MTTSDKGPERRTAGGSAPILVLRGLLALTIALVPALLGGGLAGLLFAILGEIVGASAGEGALGYGALYGAAPLGVVAGGGFGLWFGWRLAAKASTTVALAVVVPVTALIGGGAALVWDPLFAPPPPDPHAAFRINGPDRWLHLEVKLDRRRPEGGVAVLYQPVLRSYEPQRLVGWAFEPERLEDGVTVLQLHTTLAWKHSERVLEIRRRTPLKGDYLFDLPLAKVPAPTPGFGPWRRVDRILEDGVERLAPADLAAYVRWHVAMDARRPVSK